MDLGTVSNLVQSCLIPIFLKAYTQIFRVLNPVLFFLFQMQMRIIVKTLQATIF